MLAKLTCFIISSIFLLSSRKFPSNPRYQATLTASSVLLNMQISFIISLSSSFFPLLKSVVIGLRHTVLVSFIPLYIFSLQSTGTPLIMRVSNTKFSMCNTVQYNKVKSKFIFPFPIYQILWFLPKYKSGVAINRKNSVSFYIMYVTNILLAVTQPSAKTSLITL